MRKGESFVMFLERMQSVVLLSELQRIEVEEV